ncbi:hypothetical protein D3C77_352880 [compost metagenome]
MPNRHQPAVFIGGKANALRSFRAMPAGGKHLRPGQHQLHRPLHHLGGAAGGNGVRPGPQFAAKTGTDEGRMHFDPIWRQVEDIGQHVAVIDHPLGALIDIQLAVAPIGRGGMHLHRIVNFHRRGVRLIQPRGCRLPGRIRIASAVPAPTFTHAVLTQCLAEVADGRLLRVLDLDLERGCASLLEGLRNDQRHKLPRIRDHIVFKGQATLINLGSTENVLETHGHIRGAVQLRKVTVVQHGNHPRHRPCLRIIDGDDPAIGNGAEHAIGIGHVCKRMIGRVARGARHLQTAVDTLVGGANYGLTHQRVLLAARSRRLRVTTCWPNGILNALCW